MKHFLNLCLAAALAACSAPTEPTAPAASAVATDSADVANELAVQQAVQHTFDGLAAHDSAMLAAVVLPESNFQRWAVDSLGTWRTVNMSGAAFTSRLGQPGPAYLERTWDAHVQIDGAVAVYAAPYDFWVEQTCSHCGIDAIVLLQTEPAESEFGGWRIASLTYTVDATGETACRERFPAMPASPFSSDKE